MRTGLVLTRGKGESVRIGDDIVVEVAQIEGSQIRLRIVAPPHVNIVRSEIADDPERGGKP